MRRLTTAQWSGILFAVVLTFVFVTVARAGAEDAPFVVVPDAEWCSSIVQAGVIPESMFPTHEDYMVVFADRQALLSDEPEPEDHSEHGDH